MRLKRAWQQVGFLTTHIQTLEAERRALLRHREDPVIDQVRQLFTLRGIGVNSSWLYVMEFFAWRDFQTPKQVGALAGLTPTPYQSGSHGGRWGSPKRAIGISGRWRLRSPGPGAASSLRVLCRSGMSAVLGRAVPGCASSGLWPWPVSS